MGSRSKRSSRGLKADKRADPVEIKFTPGTYVKVRLSSPFLLLNPHLIYGQVHHLDFMGRPDLVPLVYVDFFPEKRSIRRDFLNRYYSLHPTALIRISEREYTNATTMLSLRSLPPVSDR